jgi:hypothetical protein
MRAPFEIAKHRYRRRAEALAKSWSQDDQEERAKVARKDTSSLAAAVSHLDALPVPLSARLLHRLTAL